ncbi:MAG: RidA family protein [Candidatus Binatia bacterium]
MSVERRSIYSGSPWEGKVAYCRAKRVGDFIAVSGTVAAGDDGRVVGPGDVHAQTLHALGRIAKALKELGSSLEDVVRTRCFLTDMDRFEDFARAHREVFEGIDPAASAVEVSRLVPGGFLVEIEVDAIVGESDEGLRGERVDLPDAVE